MSDSLQPHRLQPARLLCPCDSLGKNTGVVSHAFLQGVFRPRDWTHVSYISALVGGFFTTSTTGKPWILPVCVLNPFSCVQLFATPWTVACQAPVPGTLQARTLEWVAMPSSRGSSDPEIEPVSPASPALQADSLPLSHQGSPKSFLPAYKYTFSYTTLKKNLITFSVLLSNFYISSYRRDLYSSNKPIYLSN